MLVVDFYVYDNIITFNKRVPFNGVANTRIVINKIDIPQNGSFWFFTDMVMNRENVNIQKRYVHIHKGIGTTNKITFKQEPFVVTRSNFIYNINEKRVEVKNSIWFWKKPLFAKRCVYYGSEPPTKKLHILGEWFFDFSTNSMHFIIDYFPQKITFHWEEEIDETPTFGQLSRVEELEYQINEIEKKLNN